MSVRDESFEYFISILGESESHSDAPQERFAEYRSRLPEKLLSYWESEGFACYAGGAFWTVDPTPYQPIVDAWLVATRLEKERSRIHAIARNAFGCLYTFAEGVGPCGAINCPVNSIYISEKKLRSRSSQQQDIATQTFFAGMTSEDCDLKTDRGKRLFHSAAKRLGKLRSDQVYGFNKPLVSAGEWSVENMSIAPVREHLLSLRTLAEPLFPFA
jgi:hypothetical protein